MLGLVEAADQEQAPDLEMPRMRGIHPIAMRFERRPRRVERLRRPAQIARDECDFSLGDDTPRTGHDLLRAKRAPSASQESLRANEIAELRHRDTPQRERGRVVAQGDLSLPPFDARSYCISRAPINTSYRERYELRRTGNGPKHDEETHVRDT
jgi:hypothetical protein